MATTLINSVLHWRKRIDNNPDDDYILNVIRKLSKVPMTLELLEGAIMTDLPEINPNYHPLPRAPEFYSKKRDLNNEEAIKLLSSRKQKTAIYSGRKSSSNSKGVPRLFEICTRILIENLDAIECVGNADYRIMEPVLERCNPTQLYNIENYNPVFIESTNLLWKAHCKRDYKLLSPMEHESWRELYWRAKDEREKKLKNITENIITNISKSTPIRQVKLAYIEDVKPPRDVARKQAKHGTTASDNNIKKHPFQKNSKASSTATCSTLSRSNMSSSASKKPKVAPLMAKTLKSMQALRRK